MAKEPEAQDELWGEHTARWTFLFTVICAVLFAGSVFAFILLR